MCIGKFFKALLQQSVKNSNINISGTVSLTNNSAGIAAGGLDVDGSNFSLTGNLTLKGNYANIQGGGINVYGSSIDIT